jgi:hypothetical protein
MTTNSNFRLGAVDRILKTEALSKQQQKKPIAQRSQEYKLWK